MNIWSNRFLMVALLAVVGANLSLAKDKKADNSTQAPGEVYVHVMPEEAYVWVDDKPMTHRSHILHLPPGDHKIAVYNYGYEPQVHNVSVVSGQYQEVSAPLKRVDAKVSGPWGRIQVEGAPGNALVFMNGTTPEFFVGHVDEMNNELVNPQQLIVPVGTHEVHILANKTQEQIWAGPVEVKENQRVVIYTQKNRTKQLVYKKWPEGAKMNALARFEASTASAKIAVAPVKGKIVADRQNIKCDEPVKVHWESTDAAQATVKANDQPVADSTNGGIDTQLKQTTKYEFRAAGPGGIVTSDATVNVDPTVKTSITPATPEIRYVKVGDKVEEQGSTDLKWTATNANSVKIDPGGTVSGTDGTQTVQASPQQSNPGPVDETVTYKITATNDCGGSDTSTASVHVTGSIGPELVAAAEPPPELPQTASPLPLLALLGFACTGAGALLRRKRTM
jgi:LPXTG-motif cell wall-anchored protein